MTTEVPPASLKAGSLELIDLQPLLPDSLLANESADRPATISTAWRHPGLRLPTTAASGANRPLPRQELLWQLLPAALSGASSGQPRSQTEAGGAGAGKASAMACPTR